MFVKLTHEKGFPVYVNVGQAVVLEPAGKGTRVIFNWIMHEGREQPRVMVNEPPETVVAAFNQEYAASTCAVRHRGGRDERVLGTPAFEHMPRGLLARHARLSGPRRSLASYGTSASLQVCGGCAA